MKSFVLSICILAVSMIAMPAAAELYMQPKGGWTMGRISSSGSTTSGGQVVDVTSKVTFNGPFAGVGFGYREDYIHLLLDVRYHHYLLIEAQYETAANVALPVDTLLADQGAGLLDMGVGIGWEWNIPLITNLSMTNISPAGGSGASTIGFRVELGYFLNEASVVNLSYQTYSETSGGASGQAQLFSLSFRKSFEVLYPGAWWREEHGKIKTP